MSIAEIPQEFKARQEIAIDVVIVAGIPLPPKYTFGVSEMAKAPGMHWKKSGHYLDDGAVESLLRILARRPVPQLDANEVIFVLAYSASAFEYRGEELSRHARLMATLNLSVEPNQAVPWM